MPLFAIAKPKVTNRNIGDKMINPIKAAKKSNDGFIIFLYINSVKYIIYKAYNIKYGIFTIKDTFLISYNPAKIKFIKNVKE